MPGGHIHDTASVKLEYADLNGRWRCPATVSGNPRCLRPETGNKKNVPCYHARYARLWREREDFFVSRVNTHSVTYMNLCILSPGMGVKLELENVNDGAHMGGIWVDPSRGGDRRVLSATTTASSGFR